eukprot:Filipodium_phascolosomae@DN2790_c0_g2_i18.p1
MLKKPTPEDVVAAFLKVLSDSGDFSPECCIVCLLDINRLIRIKGLYLHTSNWRPLIVIATMIAQKIWDDEKLGTVDFDFLYPFFQEEELDIMEAAFMNLINYKIVGKKCTYTNYYFKLR